MINDPIQITAILLVLANALISYKGFIDRTFQDKYLFQVDRILLFKEYYRMVSSGFLHGGWVHLFLNMYVLYIFAEIIGTHHLMNLPSFLLIYFGSMIGGNALALYIHREHGTYRALGASGAISGVVFAFIAMFPQMKMGLLFIPFFSLPGWIFGLIYLLITLYGVRARWGNIAHEAHLGGAVAGILFAIALQPQIVVSHGWILALLLFPIVAFLYVMLVKPEWLLIGTNKFRVGQPGIRFPSAGKGKGSGRIIPFPGKEAKPRMSREEELNQLLDKVKAKGIEKLSRQEKKRLEELSQELED